MAVEDMTRTEFASSVEVSVVPRLTHLSHIHLRTPNLPASLEFFTEVLGMVESGHDGHAVQLRAWGEWMHHSLVLREAREPGVDRIAFRVEEPSHVAAFARRLREAGVAVDEVPAGSEAGQGDAIRFRAPGGHIYELFFDFDRAALCGRRSRLVNQPAPYPGAGIGARRIDHVNLLDPDPGDTSRWLQEHLGFTPREIVRRQDGFELFVATAVTSQTHDVALSADPHPGGGRLHHIAFWLDSVSELLRAAEILAECGIAAESGPGKHGGTQGWFYYIREPGGNRVELFTGGYQTYEPDWQPIVWTEENFATGLVWVGQPMSEEFLTTGTPGFRNDG